MQQHQIINKAKQLNTKVFDTKIRECTAIKEYSSSTKKYI